MAPSNKRNGLKRNHDALEEAEHPPHLEGPGEAQAGNGTDTPKSKRIKLSPRGLELLAALSRSRISINDIEFSDTSSQDGGTFADVVAATLIVRRPTCSWERTRKVAIKKLRFIADTTEEKWFCAFVNELRILDELSHPNIVEIIGFVENIESRIAWLVFRWEENGNLRQFLRSGTWELPERVSLIADVATGLEYLHTRQPPIRHGDLKSLNILVNSANRAVITDFGSARMIEPGATSGSNIASSGNENAQLELTVSNRTLTLTGPGYSTRWAAPESLRENAVDLASDIWALGWIAWEAITDCFPFPELELEWGVTMRVLEGELPPIYNHNQLSQVQSLCSIMQKCWKLDLRERPCATDCRKAIGWIPQAIPLTKHENQFSIFSLLGMFGPGRESAQSVGDRVNLANLRFQTAEIYLMGSRHVEAEASYAESLSICKAIGYELGQANALLGLSKVRRDQSKYIEAEASYVKALAIYMTIRVDVGRANAFFGLGEVRRAQGKYIEAEALYAEALTIYKTIGDDMGRANALLGLGDVRRDQSKYIEAESSYAEVLAIYEIIGSDLGRANALDGLADVRRDQSKYVEAESSYTEALAIYKTIGDDLGQANALQGLGHVRRAQSKYIEAETSYAEALAIYKIIGSDLGQANASINLAKICIHNASLAEAKALVEDAASISERIDYRWGMDTSNELLQKIFEAEGSSPKKCSLTSTPPTLTHVLHSPPPSRNR